MKFFVPRYYPLVSRRPKRCKTSSFAHSFRINFRIARADDLEVDTKLVYCRADESVPYHYRGDFWRHHYFLPADSRFLEE